MDPNQKCRGTDLKVEEVQQRLNDVMSAKLGDADRQQKFFNLLQCIGLPIDSADVHARRLSWPEMFYRVQEWIQNKRGERADRRAQKMVWATFLAVLSAAISAACALVALLKD